MSPWRWAVLEKDGVRRGWPRGCTIRSWQFQLLDWGVGRVLGEAYLSVGEGFFLSWSLGGRGEGFVLTFPEWVGLSLQILFSVLGGVGDTWTYPRFLLFLIIGWGFMFYFQSLWSMGLGGGFHLMLLMLLKWEVSHSILFHLNVSSLPFYLGV